MNLVSKYILHNFWLKLLSLALAVLLWAVVAREPVAEIVLNVPIEFHNPSDNLEISSERIPEVEVRLRGPVGRIRRLQPSEVHAVVDLAHVRPGEHTFDLSPARIGVPQGVEAVQVVPSDFRLSLDESATRTVQVHPRVTGTFATGYRIARVISDPSMVLVAGPARRVCQVDAVMTDPIDATGVVGAATFTASVYVPDPMVRVLTSSPVRVTVITEASK